MNSSLSRSAFFVVVLAAIGGTVFRVSTAPERIQQRKDTARSVCTGGGGEWIKLGNGDEFCRKSAAKDN